MATLEHRIRALEQRRRSGPGETTGTAACDVTDEELEGVIQMLRDRGEWDSAENGQAFAVGMSDAELCAILTPLVEEWRALHGYA